MKKVKTVVIGCGVISQIFLENMTKKFTILDVVGCCDLDDAKASKCAEEYKIKKMTMEEITGDHSIEMVVNLTNPAAHYPVIKTLLLAGKHVYTEKVLAVELKEAKELIEIAKEKNVCLGASPDTFLGSAVQTARNAINSGMIGEVTSCLAYCQRDYKSLAELIPYIAQVGGGIGFDLGIYYVTALASMFGPIEKVSAIIKQGNQKGMHYHPRSANFGESYNIEAETIVSGDMLFCNGMIGSVHFTSECIFPEQPGLMICGTEGIIYMADPNVFGGDVFIRTKGSEEKMLLPSNYGFKDNSRGVGAAEMAWAMRAGRKHRANHELAYHSLEVFHGFAESSISEKHYSMTSTIEILPQLPSGYLDSSYLRSDPEAALV